MKVFIVHAHHEPTSFNGALTREADEALRGAGHEVVVSDLYAMRFDPVSDRRNFTTVKNADRLKQQEEEAWASEHGGFAADVEAEIEKLFWCDALIFQFPLWWLGLPAILKGWVDRVFAMGRVYGGGRYFDRGVLVGRRAMCSVTTGGTAEAFSADGAYGPLADVLQPVHRGVLAFAGFDVVEPFVAYAPVRLGDDRRRALLDAWREKVLHLAEAPVLPGLAMAEFDGLVRKRRLEPSL